MLYDDVIKLYIALFARAPEKDSFTNWLRATLLQHWDMGALAQSMILAAKEYLDTHPQYRDIYPQYVALDSNDATKVRDVITAVYEILFNKSYQDDPQGIDTWTQSVVGGEPLGNVVASIIRVADAIAAGQIEADAKTQIAAKAFENKVQVAKYALEKFPTFDGDFAFFQSIIQDVDDTDASIAQAVQKIHSMTLDEYIVPDRSVESLLIDGGARLPQDVITYSFDEDMPSEYNQQEAFSAQWEPLNEQDKVIAREVFAYLDSFLSVDFLEVAQDGDIRMSKVAMSSPQEAGFTMEQLYNGDLVSHGVGADIFLALDYDQHLAPKDVMLHEIGHALGLKHPFEDWPTLPFEKDNSLYTIMSYTEKETFLPKITLQKNGDGYSYSVDVEPLGRQNYGIYDIEALRYLYGIKPIHSTNDSYDLSDTYKEHKFVSIIDDGGIDWVDFHKSQEPITLYLEGGDRLSSIGNHLPWDLIQQEIIEQMQQQGIDEVYFDQIFENVSDLIQNSPDLKDMFYQGRGVITFWPNSIENVIATPKDDVIYDNSLDNIIVTGPGDDVIYIKGGNDYVDGGSGYDRVVISLDAPYQKVVANDTVYLVFDDHVIGLHNIEEIG